MHNYIGTARLDGTVQNVAYTGTAGTITNGIGNGVARALISVTSAAYVLQGKSPTATTSHTYLPADTLLYVTVNPGEKFSAVQVSAAGTLTVTECG
jgi:hypothetical protein